MMVAVVVATRGMRGRGRRMGRVEEGAWGLADRSRGENGGGKFKHSNHKLSFSLTVHSSPPTRCSKRDLLNVGRKSCYFLSLSLSPVEWGPTDRLSERRRRKETHGQGCGRDDGGGGLSLLACSLRLFSLPLVSGRVSKRFWC